MVRASFSDFRFAKVLNLSLPLEDRECVTWNLNSRDRTPTESRYSTRREEN